MSSGSDPLKGPKTTRVLSVYVTTLTIMNIFQIYVRGVMYVSKIKGTQHTDISTGAPLISEHHPLMDEDNV